MYISKVVSICKATWNTWPPTNKVARLISKSPTKRTSEERRREGWMTTTHNSIRTTMSQALALIHQGRTRGVIAPSSIDSINGFMMKPQQATRVLRLVAWTSILIHRKSLRILKVRKRINDEVMKRREIRAWAIRRARRIRNSLFDQLRSQTKMAISLRCKHPVSNPEVIEVSSAKDQQIKSKTKTNSAKMASHCPTTWPKRTHHSSSHREAHVQSI